MRINNRKRRTFASTGSDENKDATNILIPLMELIVLRGLSILTDLRPDRVRLDPKKEGMLVTTTTKSITFQASLR